jgi:hypothetical protein
MQSNYIAKATWGYPNWRFNFKQILMGNGPKGKWDWIMNTPLLSKHRNMRIRNVNSAPPCLQSVNLDCIAQDSNVHPSSFLRLETCRVSDFLCLYFHTVHMSGTCGSVWLKHYAKNRKVAGSIPDEVIFFNLPNPSCCSRPWDLLSL